MASLFVAQDPLVSLAQAVLALAHPRVVFAFSGTLMSSVVRREVTALADSSDVVP